MKKLLQILFILLFSVITVNGAQDIIVQGDTFGQAFTKQNNMNTETYGNSVVRVNPEGTLFITGGNVLESGDPVEGSQRFSIILDMATLEKLNSGAWQKAPLALGSGTLFLGENIGLSSAGHHYMTERPNTTDRHLYAHRGFEESGTTSEIEMLRLYNRQIRSVSHSDDSVTFTGSSFSYGLTPSTHIMLSGAYFKTGTTAATKAIKVSVYIGTDATGNLIWDFNYPANLFPSNTEIHLETEGLLEYDAGVELFVTFTSEADFSLKTDSAGQPWRAADIWDADHDQVLSANGYADGGTYALEQWLIDVDPVSGFRKIFVCNTAGIQTGTFASNIAKWDILGSGSGSSFWSQTSGVVHLTTITDSVAIGRTDTPEGESLYVYKDFAGTTTLKVENPFVGDSSVSIKAQSSIGGLQLRAWGATGGSNAGQTWLDSYNNTGDFIIKSHTGIVLRIGIHTDALKLGDDGTFTFNDITRDRIISNSTKIEFVAPGGANNLTLTDDYTTFISNNFNVNDGVLDRVFSNETNSGMVGPNGNHKVEVSNSNIILTGSLLGTTPTAHLMGCTDLAVNNNTVDVFALTADESEIKSPDGSKGIKITNTEGVVTTGPLVTEDKYFYLGPPNVDGTGRINMNGGEIEFWIRASGVYNKVGGFQ